MSGTEPEEEEDSFGKWIFIIVSTAGFLFIALRVTFGWVDEKLVLANHQRTEGWITEYFHRSGKDDLGSGNNITYSYRVGNKTFSRDVISMNVKITVKHNRSVQRYASGFCTIPIIRRKAWSTSGL